MKKLLIILVSAAVIVPLGVYALFGGGEGIAKNNEVSKITKSVEEYTEKGNEIAGSLGVVYESIVQLDSVNYDDSEAYDKAIESVITDYESTESKINEDLEAFEKEYEVKLDEVKKAIDNLSSKEADAVEKSEENQGISEERVALEIEMMKIESLLTDLKMEKELLDQSIETLKSLGG